MKRIPIFPISRVIPSLLYYDSARTLTTPGNGNAVNYVFSANGMFDPDITGTGHQPIGFDQMMSIYEQFTVLASSITVCVGTAEKPIRYAIYLSPDASGLTSPSQIMENGLVKTVVVAGLTTASTAMVRVPTVTTHCHIPSYFGRRNNSEIVNDPELHGTSASNPTEQVYFIIAAWQMFPDGSTTAGLSFDVTLDYKARFTEPRKLAIS